MLLALVLLGTGCTIRDSDDDLDRGGGRGSSEAPYRAPSGVLLARPATEGSEKRNSTFRVLLGLIQHTPAEEVLLRLGAGHGATFQRYQRWIDALVDRGACEDG